MDKNEKNKCLRLIDTLQKLNKHKQSLEGRYAESRFQARKLGLYQLDSNLSTLIELNIEQMKSFKNTIENLKSDITSGSSSSPSEADSSL